MSIFTRPILEINLSNLLENYNLLLKIASPAIPAAVVKDDSYGLSASVITKFLYEKADCRNFFVAYAYEAEKFIKLLGTPEYTAIIQRCGLIPMMPATGGER